MHPTLPRRSAPAIRPSCLTCWRCAAPPAPQPPRSPPPGHQQRLLRGSIRPRRRPAQRPTAALLLLLLALQPGLLGSLANQKLLLLVLRRGHRAVAGVLLAPEARGRVMTWTWTQCCSRCSARAGRWCWASGWEVGVSRRSPPSGAPHGGPLPAGCRFAAAAWPPCKHPKQTLQLHSAAILATCCALAGAVSCLLVKY